MEATYWTIGISMLCLVVIVAGALFLDQIESEDDEEEYEL